MSKLICYLIRYFCEGKTAISLFSCDDNTWYFLVIAGYYLLAYVLKGKRIQWQLIVSLFLGIGCGFITWIGNFPLISKAIVLLPLFFVGQIMDINWILSISKKIWIKIVGVLFLSVLMIIIISQTQRLNPVFSIFMGESAYRNENYRIDCLLRIRNLYNGHRYYYVIDAECQIEGNR